MSKALFIEDIPFSTTVRAPSTLIPTIDCAIPLAAINYLLILNVRCLLTTSVVAMGLVTFFQTHRTAYIAVLLVVVLSPKKV